VEAISFDALALLLDISTISFSRVVSDAGELMRYNLGQPSPRLAAISAQTRPRRTDHFDNG